MKKKTNCEKDAGPCLKALPSRNKMTRVISVLNKLCWGQSSCCTYIT